jgi:hypothetical protein
MLPFNLDVTTFLPAGLDFGGFGAFGAAGLGNLMTLMLMGVLGLYCLRFLAEGLVYSLTGSRFIGSMAGAFAFGLAGYLALVKVALPLAQAWLNAMLAPLNAFTSMLY